MANGNIEIMVNVEQTVNETLHKFAKEFYEKTGVRIMRVDFDWWEQRVTDCAPEALLNNVTVTSVGSGKP